MNLSNIWKKIKSNRTTLLFVWGFLVLVLLIVYFFVIEKKRPFVPAVVEPETIIVPLRFENIKNIRITAASTFDVSELPVYLLQQEKTLTKPQANLLDFELVDLKQTETSTSDQITWTNAAGDLASYNSLNERFLINLKDSISIKTTLEDFTTTNATTFINDFLKDYFDYTPTLENVEVAKVDELQEITANSSVSGYKIEPVGEEESTFRVQLTDDKKMKFLSSYLVKTSSQGSKYPIMTLRQLQNYISRTDYPKDVEYEILGNYQQKVAYPALLTSLKITSANMISSELVYLFTSRDDNYLYPVYKLKGTGAGTLSDGTKLDLSLLIYASAIDFRYISAYEPEEEVQEHEKEVHEEVDINIVGT